MKHPFNDQMKGFDRVLHEVLCRLFSYRDISKQEDGVETLYLRRFYLWRKGKKGCRKGGVFLHNIRRSDNDRFHHDHPWDFTTRILSGGYIEQLVKVPPECSGRHFSTWGVMKQEDGTYVRSFESLPIFRIVNRGAKIHNEAEHTHKVELVKDPYNYPKLVHTWSLVNVGPARRVWGFLTDKGWVDWKTYLGIPQDAPVPEEDQVSNDT